MNTETKAVVNSIYMNIKRGYYDAADVLEEETADYKRGVKDFKELVDYSFKPYIDEASKGTDVLEEIQKEVAKVIIELIEGLEYPSDLYAEQITDAIIDVISARYGIDE